VRLLVGSLLATLSVAGTHHHAPKPKPAPARLQVVAKEYSFTFSRMKLKAGAALVELDNFGQDQHDLRVQRVGSRHIAGLHIVNPGARALLSLHLPPGRYSFWCSVANHRALGMQATLIVTR
jgi:plastocyanin